VVELVRESPPAPGTLGEWVVDDLSAPTALRPVTDSDRVRGAGRGRVWATATPDGALSVFIETLDRGHAGEHGYAYIEDGAPGWDADEHGEFWETSATLGGGWHQLRFDQG